MKEQLSSAPKAEIKWPQDKIIEVGHEVDFVYIMRKDGKFAMSPVAQKMAADFQLNEETVFRTLFEEYDTFFAKLADNFISGFTLKGDFELHLFDPDEQDRAVRLKSAGFPLISLDPLINQGVLEHKVSRGYYLGGKKDFGQVARPGSDSLFFTG